LDSFFEILKETIDMDIYMYLKRDFFQCFANMNINVLFYIICFLFRLMMKI